MQVLKGYYGAGKPVALLRGSTAKDMQPWMIEVSARAAAKAHSGHDASIASLLSSMNAPDALNRQACCHGRVLCGVP